LGVERGQLSILTASLLDMGLDESRDWTQRLLKHVVPSFVGFLGVAGAASESTSFAAILIANKIWYYNPAKVRDESRQYRGDQHTSGRVCLDRLKSLDLTLLGKTFPGSGPWQAPLVGTIASGEEVVASSERRDELTAAGRNVIGFEMEGHSFAA